MSQPGPWVKRGFRTNGSDDLGLGFRVQGSGFRG